MKKGYIKPEIEVLIMESVELMAASPGITNKPADETDALSKEHNSDASSFDAWE